jgi:hypothetical protein
MELFIHFGIYKTGSSFLQTICAHNRERLKSKAIWFPHAEKDEEMLAGKITPGNGKRITAHLLHFNRQKVIDLFSQWVKEAMENGCNSILISDEALIHAFAVSKSLGILKDAIDSTAINAVHCLGYFRDPVDHCLSTFKHRAKKGTIFDFEKWVHNDYETADVLNNFLKNFHTIGFNWAFRKYERNGLVMADFFFKEWLKVPEYKLVQSNEVNPSLSFSELSVIQYFGKWNKSLIRPVYNGFLQLSKEKKARDADMEDYFRGIAYEALIAKKSVFDELNKYLPPNQTLNFDGQHLSDQKACPAFTFSVSQVESLAISINKGLTLKNQLKHIGRSIFKKIRRK